MVDEEMLTNEVASASVPLLEDGTNNEPHGPVCKFEWKHRQCNGGKLHAAALAGDIQAVQEFLNSQEDPVAAVKSRFHYETRLIQLYFFALSQLIAVVFGLLAI